MKAGCNAKGERRPVCGTCMHAEDAGHVTAERDLYCCGALVGPLREYAAGPSAEYVLVQGCAPACLEHYERDEAASDAFWRDEWPWEDAFAHPPVLYAADLAGVMDGRY